MNPVALAPKAFFIMYELTDPKLHRSFNEHHQLDHRPENLALPGVAWGERWVRTPECAAMSEVPEPAMRDVHYLNSYWFNAPVEQSIAEFRDLGERTFQAGRQFTARKYAFSSYFDPVEGYANPRTAVSTAALPIRPNRGVYASIWAVDQAGQRDPRTHDLFVRMRESHFPKLLGCDGVAGGYIFASEDFYPSSSAGQPGTPLGGRLAAGYRIHLFYLDGDPLECGRELIENDRTFMEAAGDLAHAQRLLLASPFLAITPWQWDWFEPSDK